RKQNKRTDVAIVRIEQLYPFHTEKFQNVLSQYGKLQQIVWCQEESANNGAWNYIEPILRAASGKQIHYSGRDASASPATGSLAIHQLEQADLVERAFASY
ncbi:MAG: 2-oxoglutarate dehydrogenase E1 component, partial [Verrucomicrobiota bacterium]